MISHYIEKNQEKHLDQLFDWLRIPSISTDSAYHSDVLMMAEKIAEDLKSIGMDKVKVEETEGYPMVYAEKIIGKEYPTILVYGHYDVQPPDPIGLWKTNPFHPVIRKTDIHPKGAVFARGACDDKGQVFVHVKALEYLIAKDTLQCNVKVLIEGEEEISSINLDRYIQTHKQELQADAVLISDSAMISFEHPSICLGLRGVVCLEVELTGPNRDLHSGEYGGAVGNPIHALSTMIHGLHDDKGRISIPGFYKDVVELSRKEREILNYDFFSEKEYKDSLGISQTFGEQGYTTLERVGVRPTIDINGIWGGYMGEGSKTVLPSKAYAKISARLVPGQDSEKCMELIQKHLESTAPNYVELKITPHSSGMPSVVDSKSLECRAASLAMEKVFEKKPVYTRGGGSIPVVEIFQREMRLNTVLLGFGFHSDSIHSPNEHFGIENLKKGIQTVVHFYEQFFEMYQNR